MDDAVAEDYVKGMLSKGEVVLIDTRQHWMAAIRFALKPLVLILGIALLGVINNWLQFDGALSFINDVVSWLLLIGVIVAVVWLPIDLVRWYSRKYVLTNRRAMRMSGVLRKKSFDSSLEQINDIGFVQSVIGRTLGYADLTLYTASDTANETYDQLIDGVQFKKAVLDAKEAIRAGAPLAALPEGFIVKGGTNVASMRAEGKLEQAAAVDDGPGDGGSSPSDDAAAAPAVAAQPVAEPEPAPAAPEPIAPEPIAPEPIAPEPIAPEPIAEPTLVVEPEPEPAPAVEPATTTPEPATPETPDTPASPTDAWPSSDQAQAGGDSSATDTDENKTV